MDFKLVKRMTLAFYKTLKSVSNRNFEQRDYLILLIRFSWITVF